MGTAPLVNTLPPLSYHAVSEAVEELPIAVRTIRRVRRLSQHQAAEEIGVAQSTLAKIEDGGEYRTGTLLMILRWMDSQPETELDRKQWTK